MADHRRPGVSAGPNHSGLAPALDAALDKFSFTKGQLFDDSPSKSELEQFGGFSGTRSQFASSYNYRDDHRQGSGRQGQQGYSPYPRGMMSSARSDSGLSMSLERGMAADVMHGHGHGLDGSAFSIKSRGPALSTLSSLSGIDSPRKAYSESGFNNKSKDHDRNRFTPMTATFRKSTALGPHASESESTPSKRYGNGGGQQTPFVNKAAATATTTTRKVSPKTFKTAAALFQDLGLETPTIHQTLLHAQKSTKQQQQHPSEKQTQASFRLPRDIPDLSTLLASTRKPEHRTLDSLPVSEDNRKLFVALHALQDHVAALEQQLAQAADDLQTAQLANKNQHAALSVERERADFAERELKQALMDNHPVKESGTSSLAQAERLSGLEAQNARLLQQLGDAREQLVLLQRQVTEAVEEMRAVEEERDEAIARLAKALETIDALQQQQQQQTVSSMTSHMQSQTQTQAQAQPSKVKPSAAQRLDDRLYQMRPVQHALPKQTARDAALALADLTDEAIEVSKDSVLDEDEVRALTAEIAQTRKQQQQQQARKKQSSQKRPAAKQQQPVATKPTRARRAAVKPMPVVVETVLDSDSDGDLLSETDYAEELDEQAPDDDDAEDEEDADYLDAEEPVRILERRTRPVLHRKAASASASARHVSGSSSTTKVGKEQSKAQASVDQAALQAQVEQVIRELSKHDAARCTICCKKRNEQQQQTQAGPAQQGRQSQAQDVTYGHGPVAVDRPTTSTAQVDTDVTLRPSQPPMDALTNVLATLQDEFRHLKLDHAAFAAQYRDLAPELGKRQRKVLAAQLRTCIERLENKADQIYNVFDVVEAAGQGELLLQGVAPGTTSAAPQQQQTHAAPLTGRPPWLSA